MEKTKTKKTEGKGKNPNIKVIIHEKHYHCSADKMDIFIACWNALSCFLTTIAMVMFFIKGEILLGILTLIWLVLFIIFIFKTN